MFYFFRGRWRKRARIRSAGALGVPLLGAAEFRSRPLATVPARLPRPTPLGPAEHASAALIDEAAGGCSA